MALADKAAENSLLVSTHANWPTVPAHFGKLPEDGSVDIVPECLSSREGFDLQSASLQAAPGPEPFEVPGEQDPGGWKALASEGYTIQAFLGVDEIEALQRLRLATIPEVPAGFYISVFSAPETRRAILEGFQTILKDKLKTLAPGFRLVTASFVTKKAGSTNGRLELHQDSSLVDHRKDLGINVWVPLCDVDDHNGCLRVAGRSHRFNLVGGLPPLYQPHGAFERDLVAPCVTSLCMKAGEACLFDTRLLHASEENHSDADRVAAFFSLIPEDRPLRLHFRNPETPGRLDVFQVDTEFMLHLDPLRYPDAEKRATMTSLGSFDHVQQKLCVADFAALHADGSVAEAARPMKETPEPAIAVSSATATDSVPVSSTPSSFWKGLWKRFQL